MNTTRRLVTGLIAGALLASTLACVCPLNLGSVASQPTVQIAQPADGATVEPGQSVPVVATATDPAGLTRLEIAVDGAVLVAQMSPQPATSLAASATWSSTTPGAHVVMAQAFGASGKAIQSAPVVIHVQAASAQGGTSVPPTQVPPTQPPPPTQAPPTQVPPTQVPPTQPPPGNHAPVITALTASPQTVETGGTAALVVSAYDPDGDPVSYAWDVSPGRGTVAGGASATYNAPTGPSGVGACTITAIVSDDKGTVATQSVKVTVVRPAGLFDPGSAFQATWNGDPALQDRLGWATEPQRDLPPQAAGPQAVEQPFARGRMFWYGDVRLIYALYQDDHRWQAFVDTFSWADPAPTALPDVGCTAPMQGGFRKVWWNEPGVRARLGCPQRGEQGVTGVIQLFQHGVMIKSGLTGRVFVLFDDGTWQ